MNYAKLLRNIRLAMLLFVASAVLFVTTSGRGQSAKNSTPPPPPPKSAPPSKAAPAPSNTRPANTSVPPQHDGSKPAPVKSHTNASEQAQRQRNVPRQAERNAPIRSQRQIPVQGERHSQRAAKSPAHGLDTSKEKGHPSPATSSVIKPAESKSGPAVVPRGPSASLSVRSPAFVPPSKSKATLLPDGGAVHHGPGGREWQVDQRGQLIRYSRSGTEARFGERGQLTSVRIAHHNGEMFVNHGVRGERRIEVLRHDHSRIVSLAPNRGFVERPIKSRLGYLSRTYMVDGQASVRVYRVYAYRNIVYYRYVPVVYYQPAFYRWIYNPWPRPVPYAWGWDGEPWLVASRGYFTPSSVYSSAALWLTDFLLAENLKLAFNSRQEAQASGDFVSESEPDGTSMAITPEIKVALTEDIKSQLKEIEDESKPTSTPDPTQPQDSEGQLPPVLNPKHRIFIVSMSLDVTTSTEETCALTGGDIIVRTSDEIVDNNRLSVSVLSSKPGDCPYNSATAIEVDALQEMSNEMRAQLHSGTTALAAKQGTSSVPTGPDSSLRLVPEGKAAADADVERQLQKLQQDTDRAETEIKLNRSGGSDN
jgi:hypothetical protein